VGANVGKSFGSSASIHKIEAVGYTSVTVEKATDQRTSTALRSQLMKNSDHPLTPFSPSDCPLEELAESLRICFLNTLITALVFANEHIVFSKNMKK